MSYENAPATKLLATHCACCGRPLVDAVSAETGVGPDCRKKHGFDEPQLTPDWRVVLRETDGLVSLAEIVGITNADSFGTDTANAVWLLGGIETRRVANVLVHRIAYAFSRVSFDRPFEGGEYTLCLIRAVRALGYTKLADRVAERVARIKIELDCGEYVVRTPYSQEAAAALSGLPRTCRRWVRKERAWRVQEAARGLLWGALRRAFPGAIGVGPRGIFTVEAV